MIWQLFRNVLHIVVNLVVHRSDLQCLLIDLVWCGCNVSARLGVVAWLCMEAHVCVQITACGSLAREVPRRNFRSFVLVSSEKV
jgi:hypothetical protein